MKPIIDPRDGDIEDDASSTKRRSLFSLAGSLLAEISLPKLAVAWTLLIGLPGLVLGMTPLIVSLWFSAASSKVTSILTGISPILLLTVLLGIAWFGGRALLRLIESSFWSLNALGVQPAYIIFREGFRFAAERLLPHGVSAAGRAWVRALSAAASGVALSATSLGIAALAWPATRWVGTLAGLRFPAAAHHDRVGECDRDRRRLFRWRGLRLGHGRRDHGAAARPAVLRHPPRGGRTWRVAHLSDIHTVGERYGFRVESGRSGPRGNERLRQALARLDEIHETQPLDAILISGDLTDAGVSGEWAEFFDALAPYPKLAELLIGLPGNHDVNVVDRANPARMDLPTSPTKRLRQLRSISALAALQGSRVRVIDGASGRLGDTLAQVLEPHRVGIETFADEGLFRLSRRLADLWATVFPMVLPPDTEDGLGVIVLNSNADTHFSSPTRSAWCRTRRPGASTLRSHNTPAPAGSWRCTIMWSSIPSPPRRCRCGSARRSSTAPGSCGACSALPTTQWSCTATGTSTGSANAGGC